MRYFLDPYGCVKNQVDAETMMSSLNNAGWEAAAAEQADLIIINSCGFIQSAKQESINAVLDARKRYPEKKILLAGCLAQRYAAELALSLPEADMLFGNTDLSGITAAAEQLAGSAAPKNVELPRQGPGERPLLSLPGSAYVKISEGCNNRCSFCAIPLIRGGLRCRSVTDIVEECKQLLHRGVRELCLVGQDIGSYNSNAALPDLLAAITRLSGDFWVRLLYIHPDHFPVGILNIMEQDERVLPYFDIPFQHASKKVLAAMNRRGDAQTYLDLLDHIRGRLSAAVIRSTFLLGFPGETEEDFCALLDFQQEARLDWAGCFSYSREEDTPAALMKGRVSQKIAAERKRVVEERQIPVSEKQLERFIGGTQRVLVEECIEEGELYLGRLYGQAPEIDGAAVIHATRELAPGVFVEGSVFARSGFDLQVRI